MPQQSSPEQPLPTKREIRQAARRRRAELAAAGDATVAGSAIAEAVLRFLPERAEDKVRVAVYESLPEEPPTGPLIEALLAAGHEVIVPIVLDDFSLEWTYAAEGTIGDRGTVARLPKDTPPSGDGRRWLGVDALSTCDLVVTPGLTVDRRGTRLGQGGGCYDRALRHRDPGTPVITLLHEGEQRDTDLPREPHDSPVDGYVTTSGRVVRTAADPSPQPPGGLTGRGLSRSADPAGRLSRSADPAGPGSARCPVRPPLRPR